MQATAAIEKKQIVSHKGVSYAKWGYIFLIPFFLIFIIFSLMPLYYTFFYSFFEYFRSGLKEIGPNFVGMKNFVALLSNADFFKYTGNTILMWLLGFVPQLFFSLLLAAWFTDTRLKLRGLGFFKTVIYLPNVIMSSAFALLFYTVFSASGAVNQILVSTGIMDPDHLYAWLQYTVSTRGLIAFMSFLMWFGNTTIMIMAAIMGIDPSLFEAAEIDGASAITQFFKITIPLIRPVLLYVVVTSMIGGIQLFDVPQILTKGAGTPNRNSFTLMMQLNQHMSCKNYGAGGALSVLMFLFAAILSVLVFRFGTEKGGK